MNQTRKIFNLATLAGQMMLKNGAEIFRVEETMTRIANAYGIEKFDIFIITNGIFAIAEKDEEQVFVKIKHIQNVSVNLEKVSAINNLSRNIVEGKYTVDEAHKELLRIDQMPKALYIVRILASGLGSGGFGYIYGGSFLDSIAAFFIGLIVYMFVIYSERKSITKVISIIMGSALVAVCAILLYNFKLGDNMDKIIIGSIATLLPGVAFTNAIRNIIDGDYLSGVISLLDAILVAVSIAIGVGVVLKLYSYLCFGGSL